MTLKRLVGVAVAVFAVAVLVGSVGAGAARTPGKTAVNLSTNSKVRDYLRSLGISPRGVVIQRGARNYAGPRCPGKRWTCTRSHRVVQLARHKGKNHFRCTAARCMVVQVTKSLLAASTAKCVRTTGITQSCSITQNGTGPNTAIVYMDATKLSGLTQSATQTAQIVQTAGGGANLACVFQRTTVDGSTVAKRGMPVSVNLDAHQSISITQDSHSGANTVKNASSSSGGSCADDVLVQRQTIGSTATGTASITQNENKTVAGRNMLLDVEQNLSDGYFTTATGLNTVSFSQISRLTALATSSNGPVEQWQSRPESDGGGVDASVSQDSRAKSFASAFQSETQCARAVTSGTPKCDVQKILQPRWTQTQYGPVQKGGSAQPGNAGRHFMLRKGSSPSIQTGNDTDQFIVHQESTQDADAAPADHPEQVTQQNFVQGECSTPGNCTVDQTTTVDGQTTKNVQSGQNIDTTTSCTGDNCNTTCTGSSCTTFTESGSQLAATNVDVAKSGTGGMRGGDGTGSITVSGVDGAVAKALLYWNGPTNSNDPTVNALVSFAGTPVTGTNIGISGDNNWGFLNSQSYRADVTGLVTGNGTYALANFTKAAADINGVALVVFYVNGSVADNRNIVLWNGNDSNCLAGGEAENWDETITGVPYSGGTASLDLIVGDGQSFTDGEVDINGLPFIPAGQNFDGDSVPPNVVGGLWDVKSFSGLESFLPAASNDLHLTSPAVGDCLSLVVAAANVPVSAPVITGPAAASAHTPVTAQGWIAPSRPAARAGGQGAVR